MGGPAIQTAPAAADGRENVRRFLLAGHSESFEGIELMLVGLLAGAVVAWPSVKGLKKAAIRKCRLQIFNAMPSTRQKRKSEASTVNEEVEPYKRMLIEERKARNG
jgi:hypothetical protein